MIVYDILAFIVVCRTIRLVEQGAFKHLGIKDATSGGRPPRILNALGSGFAQPSGEDATTLPYLAGGGHGAISVTSNIAPRQIADMHNAWQAGDIKTAQEQRAHD